MLDPPALFPLKKLALGKELALKFWECNVSFRLIFKSVSLLVVGVLDESADM